MYLAHGEESEKSLYCACKQSPCPLIPTRVLPSLRNQAISKKTAEVPRGALSHQSAASSFDGPCRLCVSIILPHNILRHSSLEENNFSPPYIHSPGGCPHSSYNPNERDPSATWATLSYTQRSLYTHRRRYYTCRKDWLVKKKTHTHIKRKTGMAFIRWQVDWNDIHPSGMERDRGESRLCRSSSSALWKEACPSSFGGPTHSIRHCNINGVENRAAIWMSRSGVDQSRLGGTTLLLLLLCVVLAVSLPCSYIQKPKHTHR